MSGWVGNVCTFNMKTLIVVELTMTYVATLNNGLYGSLCQSNSHYVDICNATAVSQVRFYICTYGFGISAMYLHLYI